MKKFYILPLLLFIFISIVINPISTCAATNNSTDKKVVLLVMDYVDTKDLESATTPNLDKLIDHSGTGLMNIRAKNRYPSSSYMSIAVGNRVGTINRAELSFNSQEEVSSLPNVFEAREPYWTAHDLYNMFTGLEAPKEGIVNLYVENIKKSAVRYNPSFEIGQIGKIAKANNLNVTVLGNADTIDTLNRDIVLLGMDENGIVLQGDVSSNLLENDPFIAGGVKTNHELLLQKIKDYLPSTNLLIVDLGDTTRVEVSRFATADQIVLNQRKMAIERNDELIGKLIPLLDLKSTMVMIITPNPHREMVSERNFGLTPVIIYDPDQAEGLLTSPTTRRSGLISNLDIMPTIFSFLEAEYNPNLTTGVQIIKSQDHSMKKLDQDLTLYKNLRANRSPLHTLFICLILITFAIGIWILNFNKHNYYKVVNFLVSCILSIPIIWMFISIINYESVVNSIAFTLIVSLVVGSLLYKLFKPLNVILILTALTSLLLTIDCFMHSKLMLISPLGSDAIAGGRYYGIGNDFMGILLASSVIFVTLLVHRLNVKPYLKAIIGLPYLLIVSIAIGHPNLGANVGGLITSLVTVCVFFLYVTGRKINLKKIFIIGIVAVLGVIGVAQLDAIFSSNPSHAGKAINSLFNGGFIVFFSIIGTKLGILANTVYTSNWSIVMIVSVAIFIYIWTKFKDELAVLALKLPSIMSCIRILTISAVTVFIVNDTGIIASALIFTYIISSLWVGLSEV